MSMESITDLPEDIICHIISFLAANEAVRFKSTSKEWRNLNIFIEDAVFDSSYEISRTLKDFTDQLVARDISYRIKRCSLKLRSMGIAPYDLVNACMENVSKRGVFDLEVDINAKENNSLPSEFFACKPVVKLKIGSGFVIDMIPEDSLFPSLKKLFLDSLRFDDKFGCAFQRLLSACPVLEELIIDGLNWEQWKWSGLVSSPTLKRFITWREWKIYWVAGDDDQHQSISFDTPSLLYLEYTDVPQLEYNVVNLNSLVEAKLQLPMYYSEYYDFNLTNLIQGLRNVEILSSDYDDTIGMFYEFNEAVPLFDKLLHLSIRTAAEVCWIGVEYLLENSPHLKHITIDGVLHCYAENPERVCDCLGDYSFLLSSPIEVLRINHFGGVYSGELVHIREMLKNLPSLVLLEVHVEPTTYDKKQKIMNDLVRLLPKDLSHCTVQVESS